MTEFCTAIDFDSPVSEAMPAGLDLQDSPEFAELEVAASGSAEQQYGSIRIPAREPDWQRVLDLATELLQKTRDLRILLFWCRALTRVHGLDGLTEGIRAANALVRTQWAALHPGLVVDGEEDPQIRYGALLAYTAADGLLSDVRGAIVFQSPLGAFTVRDLERLSENGNVEINGRAVERSQVEAVIAEQRAAGAGNLDATRRLIEAIDALHASIRERSEPEYTPELRILRRPLQRIQELVGAGADTEADRASATTMQPGDTAQAAEPAVPGALRSRADVIRAMNAICDYLEAHEPTNPAPLLIRRARRLMDMNFLEIVQDMSPDGVNQVLFVTGASGEQRSNP